MNKLSKQMLLLVSCGLVLASCGIETPSNPVDSADGSKETPLSSEVISNPDESNPTSEGQDASSSQVASSSKVDYTAGWSALPELAETIQRYCGGNQIPFIDLQGTFHAVNVPKSATLAAHLMIYTSGSFDRTLVYNTNITYKKAGWEVYFDVNTLEMTAEDPETGIYIHFYGKDNVRDGGKQPYLDIFFQEKFKTPESGSWSMATNAVLTEINAVKPHALPYCYLGTTNESATKINGSKAEIHGGDWGLYESDIVGAVKNSLSAGRNWTYTKGTKIASSGKFPSEVYTWKKSFSDGYTLSVKLYGAVEGYYYTSSSAVAEVFAVLEVTVVAPK